MLLPAELMAMQLERVAFYVERGHDLPWALRQTANDLRRWFSANQGMTIQSATKDFVNHEYSAPL